VSADGDAYRKRAVGPETGKFLNMIARNLEAPTIPVKVDIIILDLWRDLYAPCLEAFHPKLNPGAIVVADNMIAQGTRT
jgi:hypothetical protein